MQDLVIAVIFLAFVASPAIFAALPISARAKRPERHTEGVDFPLSSLHAWR